jgi:5-deoxy-glucuronate isomerase
VKLHVPAGSGASGDDPLLVTPEGEELAVLPLSGGGCTVEVEGRRFELRGRESVFARVTDWAYVPIDAELRLSSAAGCELAIASSRAERRFDPAYVEAGDVPVELRGAGQATRQLNNFMVPGVFDGADRLICCEVYTPDGDGNWSSYPPHKHDASTEVNNEEIYYFRVARVGSPEYSSDGYAVHRTYTDDRSIDETLIVRDGDAFLIPEGYHGPCVAAPGYPLYYLNVMASDSGPRALVFSDDPSQHWIRATWEDMPLDPRLPMTSAAGIVERSR